MAERDQTYRIVTGKELRDLLCSVLSDGEHRSSHELLIKLRERGLQPSGADYKGRIRNLHACATRDDRILKVRAGIFGSADAPTSRPGQP